MIDVQKLAREAGFDVALFDINGPLVYEAEPKHVSMLIALVLEEVANKFDQPHMEYFGQEIQDYIRSLKPKGEA